jgi:hypothetical protein
MLHKTDALEPMVQVGPQAAVRRLLAGQCGGSALADGLVPQNLQPRHDVPQNARGPADHDDLELPQLRQSGVAAGRRRGRLLIVIVFVVVASVELRHLEDPQVWGCCCEVAQLDDIQ